MLEPAYTVTAERPLRTARLTLRPYEATDLPFLQDMFGRDDVCRYLPWAPMDGAGARAKVEQRLRQTRLTAEGDALVLLAAETATGRPIGEFMLRLWSVRNGHGEVGWSLHPDAQGRGFATEGAREMLRVGFADVGLHRITAGSDPRNLASLRVMDRLGMRREAELLESEFVKGEWVGEILSALLADEWRAMAT